MAWGSWRVSVWDERDRERDGKTSGVNPRRYR